MARSHWRSATGAGLLAAGLMANVGTAVAIADSGDTTGDADKTPASPSTNNQNPLGSIVKNLTTTIHGATTAVGALAPKIPTPVFGSGGSASSSPGTTVPKMLSDAIRIPTTITGFSGPKVTAPLADPADPTDTPTDPTDAPTAVAAADATSAPAATTPKKTSPAPVTTPLATALSSTLATTGNQITHTATQLVDGVVAPATAALGDSVQNLAAPVGSFAGQLTAPIPDVLSSIQALLTSTTSALAPVTQFPTDLISLLGAAETQPVTGRIGTDARATLPAVPSASVPSTGLLAATAAGASTVAEKATQTPPVTVTALSEGTRTVAQAAAVNASARATPGNVMSEGLQAFFHSYGALVIAASLSALAAAALPGLIAFLVPTVAGVGLGYRQAKAGIALRASGIARFAGSGPMGIVRSGSLISLRQSAVRVSRPARNTTTAVAAVERSNESHFAA